MKKEYKAPEIERAELSVCDVIAASTAVTPGGKDDPFMKVADFDTWFNAN